MLREQTGEQLAKTQLARNETDKAKDERELVNIRELETVKRSLHMKQFTGR